MMLSSEKNAEKINTHAPLGNPEGVRHQTGVNDFVRDLPVVGNPATANDFRTEIAK